jgi:hypothetical protein
MMVKFPRLTIAVVVTSCACLLGALVATVDSVAAVAAAAAAAAAAVESAFGAGGGDANATAGVVDDGDPAHRRSSDLGCSTAESAAASGTPAVPPPGLEHGEEGIEVRQDPAGAVVVRELAGTAFFVNTTGAPVSVGNPNTGCLVSFPDRDPFNYVVCINNCRSLFYRVIGTGESITASSCGAVLTPAPGTPVFYQQLYVWEGQACADFACISTL